MLYRTTLICLTIIFCLRLYFNSCLVITLDIEYKCKEEHLVNSCALFSNFKPKLMGPMKCTEIKTTSDERETQISNGSIPTTTLVVSHQNFKPKLRSHILILNLGRPQNINSGIYQCIEYILILALIRQACFILIIRFSCLMRA